MWHHKVNSWTENERPLGEGEIELGMDSDGLTLLRFLLTLGGSRREGGGDLELTLKPLGVPLFPLGLRPLNMSFSFSGSSS